MEATQAMFGSKIFSAVARPTFYNQFVGGDCENQLKSTEKQQKIHKDDE